MATRDLFATEDLSASYSALPAIAGASAVASRKLIGYYTHGGQPLVRSSDPEGYFIPDLDSWGAVGWSQGTALPEATAFEMGKDVMVFRFLRSSDVVPVVRHQSLDGGNIFLFTNLAPSPGDDWGAQGAVHELSDPIGSIARYIVQSSSGIVQSQHIKRQSTTADGLATELRADASVAEITTRIATLSRLTDQELARLFRVARETYQRWRTGELTNPTQANRRRQGLLLRLLQDLDMRGVEVGEWLKNVSDIDNLTPYQLLERGRLDEVESLAAKLPGHPVPRTEVGDDRSPRTQAPGLPVFGGRDREPAEDLVLEDDEGWVEVEAEAIEDDE